MSRELLEAVEELAASVAAMPGASHGAVVQALERAASLLRGQPPAAPGAVAPMVHGAAHILTREVADGSVDEQSLSVAARAVSALFDGAASDALQAMAPGGPAAPVACLRASRGRPVVLAVPRAAFAPSAAAASSAPTPGSDADAGEDEGDDEDEDEDEAAQGPREIGPDTPEDPPRPPANDVVLPTPMRPRVRIDGDSPPLPGSAVAARASHAALDGVAALARQRMTLDLADRPGIEARLLAYSDAAAVTGGDLVGGVVGWWETALDRPDPTPAWAASFVLGLLAGDDAMVALAAGVEKLAPDAFAQGDAVADALALAPHPGVPGLVRCLSRSTHPLARAVAVEVLGRGAGLAAEQLRWHLLDPNAAVLRAALRAAARLRGEEVAPLVPLMRLALRFPEPAVARAAARALLLHGDPTPWEMVSAGDAAAERLGLYQAEVILLRGSAGDMDRLDQVLRRWPVSAEHLGIIARWGHAGAAPFLLHWLADGDLADDAAAALKLLFGARVEETELLSVAAWRAAIDALAPSHDIRHANGEPWRPRVLADRLAAGELPPAEAEALADELAIRVGVGATLDTPAWSPEETLRRAAVAAEAKQRDARYGAGRWTLAAR